jgi:hypothetical protein
MDNLDYTNNFVRDRFSITPSGYFGTDKKNIQGRENFISLEDLDFLSNAAKNITIWDLTETHYDDNGVMIYDSSYWENRVATSRTLLKNDERINPIIEKLQERLKEQVDEFFGVDAWPTSPAIVRWLPGQYQNPHADKELHEGENAGKPNDFPYYDIAGLFYLNDDYQGGELYFPKQGVQFKPKAGAAYFFPGDLNYIHGVTEITEGIRYVVPFFFTILSHKDTK